MASHLEKCRDIQTDPYKYLYSQLEVIYQKPILGLLVFGGIGFGIGMVACITRSGQWNIVKQRRMPAGILTHILWSSLSGGGMGLAYSFLFSDRKGSQMHRIAKDEIRKIMMQRSNHKPFYPASALYTRRSSK